MTTSPSSQLWHPSRGISFSPTPAKSWSWLGLSGKASPQEVATEKNQRDVPTGGGEKQRASTLSSDGAPATHSNDASATADEAAVNVILDPPDLCVPSKAIPNDPPYPALEWKVSEPLFRSAKSAAPGTPQSFWSYRMYRGPGEDGSEQPVKVHYCKSRHTTDRVCEQYFMNEKVLGFDLEWVAEASRLQGTRRNVSLIQLASPSRIALFHVACFPKDDSLVSPFFKKIMEDSNIAKVGVWIRGDATRLRTHMNIESKGLMELSHLNKLVTHSRTGEYKNINKKLIPLATQVEQYLHLPMFKGTDVRSSDWARPLSMDQVIYSASDAYAGVQLYATLEHHRKQLDPCPPTPHHAELELPIRLTDGSDLETSSDEELVEQPEAEDDQSQTLSPAARRRLLKAHVKPKRSRTKDAAKTTSEAERELRPKDARVQTAEAWAAAFKKENQPDDPVERVKSDCASAYELRAYHIWHTNKELSASDIASILRNPPLVTKTVANYIWGAVRKEGLPVDRTRYMAEVVQLLPEKQSRMARQALSRFP
ncbi:3'-5' exonuclease [Apiospora phragmitis]|uniref:3'-5' exonuclease n=1 Tax=Apiospora phragmitis TaxID=2905665 RepID=A0ABR1UIL6_9PEZI